MIGLPSVRLHFPHFLLGEIRGPGRASGSLGEHPGARSWSVARELTRVATTAREAEWIRASESKTVREIERMVAGRAPGDAPDAPKDPLLEKRRLVFEVSPNTYALVQQALEHLRQD